MILEIARLACEREVRWADTERILLALRDQVTFAEASPPVGNWIPDDPPDNWVIRCALTANAERMVIGDRKLLDVGDDEDRPA